MNIQLYKKYYECGDGCCSEWYGYFVIDGVESEREDSTYVDYLHDFLTEAGIVHEWTDTVEEDYKFYEELHKEQEEFYNRFNKQGEEE